MHLLGDHRLAYTPFVGTFHALYMMTHLSEAESRVNEVALGRLNQVGIHENRRKALLYYSIIAIPILGTLAALVVDLWLSRVDRAPKISALEEEDSPPPKLNVLCYNGASGILSKEVESQLIEYLKNQVDPDSDFKVYEKWEDLPNSKDCPKDTVVLFLTFKGFWDRSRSRNFFEKNSYPTVIPIITHASEYWGPWDGKTDFEKDFRELTCPSNWNSSGRPSFYVAEYKNWDEGTQLENFYKDAWPNTRYNVRYLRSELKEFEKHLLENKEQSEHLP